MAADVSNPKVITQEQILEAVKSYKKALLSDEISSPLAHVATCLGLLFCLGATVEEMENFRTRAMKAWNGKLDKLTDTKQALALLPAIAPDPEILKRLDDIVARNQNDGTIPVDLWYLLRDAVHSAESINDNIFLIEQLLEQAKALTK